MNKLISNLKQDINTYFSNNNGALIKGDCLDKLKLIPDKSINLAIYDAPYFSTGIKEVGDKQWKKEEDYIEWCIKLIKETQRVLKDNGSFYWFHNDVNIMIEILHKVKHETNFKLKNQITWSKINNWKSANIKDGAGMYRSILQCYGKQRSYNNSTTEYIYYFTMQNETGLKQFYDVRSPIQTIKQYLRDERDKAYEIGYTDLKLRAMCGLTLKGGGMLCHYWGNTNWVLPVEKYYKVLQQTGYFQKPYKNLKQEYEDARYTFNQPRKVFKGRTIINIREELKPFTTVWEYERDNNIYGSHLTPKPLKMIKHIIETSSNGNDIVLDCFSGSGTLAVACEELHRDWICIELDEKYCEITKNRLINIIN